MTTSATPVAPAPLTAEETARAVAAAETAVFNALNTSEVDDCEVGDYDASEAEATAEGAEVDVYAMVDHVYLTVTVKLTRCGCVRSHNAEGALERAYASMASDAYTYAVEGGHSSAWE